MILRPAPAISARWLGAFPPGTNRPAGAVFQLRCLWCTGPGGFSTRRGHLTAIRLPENAASDRVERRAKPAGVSRPAIASSCDLLLGPYREAFRFRCGRVLDADSRIRLHMLGFGRPPEKAAHRVKEVASLERGIRPPVPACSDGVGSNARDRLVASRRQHLL